MSDGSVKPKFYYADFATKFGTSSRPHIVKLTSNVLVTLVLTEQDCSKELFKTVNITRRFSEFIWQ